MSQHEKNAWWSLGCGLLIWLFLLTRFTDGWRIVELPAGDALETYIEMIVLSIVAAVVPAVLAERKPESMQTDERDRTIEALGDRWEGWVVVIAVNALIVYMLSNAFYADRTPSLPRIDLGSTTAMVFALLTVLFLADGVKRAVIVWQYRR